MSSEKKEISKAPEPINPVSGRGVGAMVRQRSVTQESEPGDYRLPAPRWDYWTRLDRWKLEDAILLLLEFEPKHEDASEIWRIVDDSNSSRLTYHNVKFSEPPLSEVRRKAKDYYDWAMASHATRNLNILIADWDSGSITANEWLNWAQEKRLPIPEALLASFFPQEPLESHAWEGFDPESETYPEELDIALQAWRSVTLNRKTDNTPKEQISEWLSQHYPKLSTEAKQRIATICNWQKEGGRRKRE